MALILIVDDDPGVRDVLRRILVREGHQVTEEPDGQQAIRALKVPDAVLPDVIIADVYMPEMDGIEFLIHLSQIAPGIPTITTSGGGLLGDTNVLADTRHFGAVATLPKPFTTADVLQVLTEVLPAGT
jgi:CheY-like chemotaxis protein